MAEVSLIESAEESTRVALSGRLDIAGVGAVEPRFTSLTSGKRKPTLGDVSGVEFIASIGMGMIVREAKVFSLHGARMVLLQPPELVARTCAPRASMRSSRSRQNSTKQSTCCAALDPSSARQVGVADDAVTVTVEDDGIAFDPTLAPEPGTTAAIGQWKVGGLGLKLIRRWAEDWKYERSGARNRLQIRVARTPE